MTPRPRLTSSARTTSPKPTSYRDAGVSGGTGTNSRAGWRALDARLQTGDTLVVVAADRIGRSWLNTVNTIRDLRTRGVRIRSLAPDETTWVSWLESDPDSPEAFIADILTSLMAWTADQERQAASRRTKAGLEKAVAEGKTLGPPRKVNEDQVEEMARLKRAGLSYRTIGRRMVPNVSGDTVMRKLRERQG